MTERAAFLAAVREARDAASATRGHRPPLLPLRRELVPRVSYRGSPTGVGAWEAAWSALGGHTHRVEDAADVPGAVTRAVARRRPVMVGADPLVAGVDGDLRWPECGLEGAVSAEVCVVGAVAGVAATGSLVLDSALAAGRAVSLLPGVAVFVLRAGDIVDTPGDVLRTHSTRWPSGPPSQVVFVTGPSRSADIEMTLTVGVHGPGEVHAVIVGNE